MSKIKEMYIRAKVETTRGDGTKYTMNHLLSTYFKVPPQFQDRAPITLIEAYQRNVNKERVEEFLKNEPYMQGGTHKLLDYYFVYITSKGRYKKGEYFAHELDDLGSYFEAKARKISWNDGVKEYEVKILDKKIDEMTISGIWTDELLDGNHIASGTGDHFESYEGKL